MTARVCKTCGAESPERADRCAQCGRPFSTSRLVRALYLGPILLYLAATGYGILEVHFSNDTWIGLAAGRQILTSDPFPTSDTFSYTFAGRTWYNQNWLTHVAQYWLYSRIAPNAVVYGTWAVSASIFALVLLAAYWRTGSWLGALLVAAIAALGCRDFLYARPATIGFFCIAGLWTLLCAIEGQGEKHRRWPVMLLLPLLLLWGNAHGSFVFGYGVLGLYVAHWIILRFFRRRAPASGRQITAIVLVIVAALLLTIALGPFGLENFTHGEKVAGGEVFRKVSEWYPPTARGEHFPPVWRFWTILWVSLGTLLGCGLLGWLARKNARPAAVRIRLHTSFLDAAVVIVGLSLTFWARRFAPIFFIFGAPVLLTWILLLLRPLWTSWRRHLQRGLMVAAGLFAIVVALDAAGKARDEIGRQSAGYPGFNLLQRVTRYDMTPHEALLFLEKNDLNVNLLVEWSQGGHVMFYAPNAKIFMDGRSQQLYDEAHVSKYALLLLAHDTPAPLMMRLLDERYPGGRTDAVLLRRWERPQNLLTALRNSDEWVPALLNARYTLFLRRNGRGLAQLGELLRRGEEWRPGTPIARATRGLVWAATTPPDLEQALACWRTALRQDLTTGLLSFRPMTRALLELDRKEDAERFVEMYSQALQRPFAQFGEAVQRQLLETLAECRRDIRTASDNQQ